MNIEIKIITDNQVQKLLKDKRFIAKWQELANQNQKVTVQQEPAFVTTWYRIYSNQFMPILILGYDQSTELIGLIPLALSIEDQYLTHAGASQAEYKGWLCKKEVDQYFPEQALIAIKNHFQITRWNWGWVSPGSNINWLTSETLKKEKIHVKFFEEDSPILDLYDDALLERLRKSRSLKTKMNRFKKRENFHIERITSKERAKNVFDIIEKQCDFRQMAANQDTPFTSDPNKKPFHIEKLDFPESNHFAVLWSNNHPIAFNYGECDSDTVLLGVTSFDPLEGRNSPGVIFIMKLAELLKAEGFKYFDLSPGGNEYKQTFCNLTQKVYNVTLIFNTKDHLIYELKVLIKKALKQSKIKPAIILNKLSNATNAIKKTLKRPALELFENMFSIFYQKKTLIYYHFTTDQTSIDAFLNDQTVNTNNYSDLLLYKDSNQFLEKTDVISRASKRFNKQDVLYTIVIDGELALYGWINNQIHEEVITPFDLPNNSMILYDLFTSPAYNEEELFEKTIKSMLVDCKKNGAKEVFFKISKNDTPKQNTLEKIGFKRYLEVMTTKSFGIESIKTSSLL